MLTWWMIRVITRPYRAPRVDAREDQPAPAAVRGGQADHRAETSGQGPTLHQSTLSAQLSQLTLSHCVTLHYL